MIYFYKILGSSFEESVKRVFYSDEQLSDKQLFERLKLAAHDHLDSIKDEYHSKIIDIMCILSDIDNTIFIKHNLHPLKIEASVDLWGWNCIGEVLEADKEKREHYWHNESTELDREFIDSIKEKALTIIDKVTEDYEIRKAQRESESL